MAQNKTSRSPRQDSKFTSNNKQKVEFKGYVNFSLTETHKKDFAARMAKGQSFLANMGDYVERGYSIKVRWDSYNKAFSGQIYCENADDSNAGWSLSARASDPYIAIERVAYIHLVVLDGLWTTPETQERWDDEKW